MSEETTLKTLKRHRAILKGNNTKFATFLNSFIPGQSDKNQLKIRREKFESIYEEFNKVQLEIETITSIEDNEERETFEEVYYDNMAKAEKLSEEIKDQDQAQMVKISNIISNGNGPVQNHNSDGDVRLPPLNLPTFDGSYDQWLLFSDSFDAIINKNTNLTNVRKFQYLQSSLRGEALNVIRSLEMSNDNYQIAWDILKERYHNTKFMISTHIKAIFNIPETKKESHSAIRNLVDTVQRHLRALKILDQPVESWDLLLIHIISQKMDYNTSKEWETLISKKKDIEMPTVTELMEFLNQRCRLLEAIQKDKLIGENSHTKQQTSFQKSFKSSALFSSSDICELCNQSHKIYTCKQFLDKPVPERINYIKMTKRCYNCLQKDHQTINCMGGKCKKCQKKHATLLHLDKNVRTDINAQQINNSLTNGKNIIQKPQHSLPEPAIQSLQATDNLNFNHQDQQSVSHHTLEGISKQVLLSTAKVLIYDAYGQEKYFRVLLDSGSQSNCVTSQVCQELGLTTRKITHKVTGFGTISQTITEEATITIHSIVNRYKTSLKFLVIPRITENLPIVNIPESIIKNPSSLTLADPEFNKSSKIDLLLGAEIFFEILCIGQFRESRYSPIFQKTNFGWILSGEVSTKNIQASNQDSETYYMCNLSLEEQIEKFWEMEELIEKRKYSQEEEECEVHFLENVKKTDSGQFIVKLPFNSNKEKLGESYQIAVNRFMTIEQRLKKNCDLTEAYKAFMKEYEDLGHMKHLPIKHYFLPHHAVVKQDSLTTKVRVVFDGSASSSSGISLNQALKKGPVIQSELFEILLRFRINNIAVTADIAKMYRQVLVDEEDANFQLIVWRENPLEEIKIYKLLTVTYGTTTAPFLSTRCLKEISISIADSFPQESKIISSDFYIDDLLTTFNNPSEAQHVLQNLNTILEKNHFQLRKYRSNDSSVLNNLKIGNTSDNMMIIDSETSVKTLGLYWNSFNDQFEFIPNEQSHSKVSKRIILSTISKLFDPLGLLGPMITLAKLIIQDIWKINISWDESVPEIIHSRWTKFITDLPEVKFVKIPRKITDYIEYDTIEIHGFSDASIAAYGACVYIRTTSYDGSHSVHLLCSKSRVSPIKPLTLPRLELCGALLLAKLINKVKISLKIAFDKTVLWTDSTIVLAWLRMDPSLCKTFVCNRITEIQKLTSVETWRHIPGHQNPADLISRGVIPSKMITNVLWWSGPLWLLKDESFWPEQHNVNSNVSQNELEMKKNTSMLHSITKTSFSFEKFSSFSKLQRTMAWILRFKNNSLNKSRKTTQKILSIGELKNATKYLMRLAQQEYIIEIIQLKNDKGVNHSSKIFNLNPYLDEDGILRVGGRIQHANISQTQKHQYIIPPKHPLTVLIIRHEHQLLLHAGTQSTLYNLRLKYWIPSGKNAVKKVLRACITCFRAEPKLSHQLMGNLPARRIQEAMPFEVSGVDFGGPMMVRENHRKGKKYISKCYIAVFVCFVTKAVHIELVSSLSTEAFIATLRRFTSRRGHCKHLYSDNATNFHGAYHELKEIQKFLENHSNQEIISQELSSREINWHFIPPKSPHMGGLWENSIKSIKKHIKKVIGDSLLTFEEYATILTQIEFCLNSRPLSPLSDDPSDLNPLTPNHFLIGHASSEIQDLNFSEINSNRLSRWQHLQKIKQDIWKRWKREYLSNLQQRSKWSKQQTNVKVGDLVLVTSEMFNKKWPLGRVIAVHPGEDNVVRVVTVKLGSSLVKRNVNKIAKLPLDL